MNLKLRKKILIVDDDENDGLIAESILQDYFSVTTVPNGHVALKAVEMMRYDAVLMDINLGDPRMDGIKTMHMIKENKQNKRIKVFAITAFSDARDWYIKQGFEDLILKPLDENTVINVINSKLAVYITGKSLFRNIPFLDN
jgi:CheY-like chemotaxis protein